MYENPEQAFGGTTRLLALIESIYAAVNEPSLWPSILDRFAEAAHGNQTFMFTDTSDPAIPSAMIGSKTDPAALTLLLDYYASINIFAEPAHAVFRDGDIRYSHLVVPDAELERSEFYNDFFKPFDMHYWTVLSSHASWALCFSEIAVFARPLDFLVNIPVAGQTGKTRENRNV